MEIKKKEVDLMSLKDKVVIITGASSGIGESTAKRLAADGAKVVLGARNERKLAQIREDITAKSGQAIYQRTDVTKYEDNQNLVKRAENTFGKVDAIFLNAGIMPSSRLAELKVADWDQTIDVNLKGVLYGIAAVLPLFKKQNSGQIITTSSVAGLKVYPGYAPYCATKWAIRKVMETLRLEAAQDKANIRTTTICPASVHSNLIQGITNSDIKNSEIAVRSKTELPADEVAKAVEYVIAAPEKTEINELTIGPLNQGW